MQMNPENGSNRDGSSWPGVDCHYLIFEAEHSFIVYLDSTLTLDWETSSEYDKHGHNDPRRFNEIICRAATLECVPNGHHIRDLRIAFKRMIGEGIARALDHDYESATKILDQAKAFIADRNHRPPLGSAEEFQLHSGVRRDSTNASVITTTPAEARTTLDWGRRSQALPSMLVLIQMLAKALPRARGNLSSAERQSRWSDGTSAAVGATRTHHALEPWGSSQWNSMSILP